MAPADYLLRVKSPRCCRRLLLGWTCSSRPRSRRHRYHRPHVFNCVSRGLVWSWQSTRGETNQVAGHVRVHVAEQWNDAGGSNLNDCR